MGAARRDVIEGVCRVLEHAGDPERARGQQAYLKSGAWWDFVDEIASHRVGPVLRAHPETESDRMRSWARADSMWVRRAALLSQLSSKGETDRQLLLDCVTPNLADREFFIRKAVGWSLRQYARSGASAADWVRAQVDDLGRLCRSSHGVRRSSTSARRGRRLVRSPPGWGPRAFDAGQEDG